jgi:ribonucleoside-diphosphate reductase alpha chain
MAIAPERMGIGIRRHFTTPGVHPYDEVTWERRDARITNYQDGSVAFEQLGVEVPSTWSVNATNILAQKYFRGAPGSPEREWSLKQVADRVADTITAWGARNGYFVDGEESEAFNAELKHLVVNQKAAFNSPVWFNIGVPGRTAQSSACFILSVDDSMREILNWYAEEGIIFKGGSGAGVNLSKIRSSKETLKGGGTASGPVSFMRGADASAGTIKSGGTTRRAAKMVILNVDHPDVEDFIWCKAIEERKARALRDAGFDMDLDGKDSYSIQYQNANNSVRLSDEFMQAVVDDADWHLKAVTTGETLETVKARDLFAQIAKAAWECADPGVQYDTTINRWHTLHTTGRINGSNPCSEYMSVDNSACNLASLNLLRYMEEGGTFDVEGFKASVEVLFTAQEILVGMSDYPTEKIGKNARRFRQLGIGYANLGALLMSQGMAYDSDNGRAYAAAITALMTGQAYATSARTAARMAPFAGYTENAEHMLGVLRMHRDEVAKVDEELVPTDLLSAAQETWDHAVEDAERYGVRNSQASVLAPTGCLVGGTLVPTERGLVRLRSLGDTAFDAEKWQDLGISVQTDEGARTATQFYVNGLEPVVRVQTKRGYSLQGTAQHRVKVVDAITGELVWRRLSDVVQDDLVPMALRQLVGGPQAVPLPPLPEAYWTGEHHSVAPRAITAELAELVGYFMGDGSLHARGVRFCVANGDFDVVERLLQLGKEVFNLVGHVTGKRGYTEVRLDSVRLVLWWEACGFAKRAPFEGHVGKGYVAHVPDAVLHSNDPAVYGAFLRGLFEADGTVTVGYPHWMTTSLELAGDVQTMLLALGFPTTRGLETKRTGWGQLSLSKLRLLNLSYNDRWLEEVGFMGARKNAKVIRGADLRQSARGDHIPLSRPLIDRLAPENDRLRKVLLMECKRGTLTRRVATELFERTGDAELGHLLSFFYDRVASAELGDEELTYDLSVPDNVTYLANGFISHNTISFLLDCDTTGVEPDLGLVKMKKLVGGGTMSIVNHTVPRALRQLGYPDDEVAAIVRYLDEHKTIMGAPALKAEHLPVFACSMGENYIHYLGHVRMMAAVQPFISGALSKTVNVPEGATVEDIEQLYLDSWQMGIKALAVYRDNCKVAQPLSTVRKGTASDGTPSSEAEAHDQELAVKVAELEKALDRQTVVVKQPIRERLPRRRQSATFAFRVADCEGYVTVGEYDDGRPGEMFVKVSKQGSTLAGVMDAFSISISLGLQHGVPLKTYVQKYTNMRFEPAGMTDDPDLRIAASLMDYIFRRLAVDYLALDERTELGILTTGERTQPTLPGVEEDATPSEGVVEAPASESTRESRAAMAIGKDAPFCYSCGVEMQRAGSCYACGSCGATSGCS